MISFLQSEDFQILFFLYKNNDLESMSSIARKFSLKACHLKNIFSTFTKYDSLLIDDTRSAEYKLRKNIYDLLTI